MRISYDNIVPLEKHLVYITCTKRMSRLLKILLITTLIFLSDTAVTEAKNKVDIYLFYSKTCPHCEKERLFLNTLKTKYSELAINEYEITTNKQNMDLFVKVGKTLSSNTAYVPFLIIGNKVITGYLNDETTGAQIEQQVINAIDTTQEDIIKKLVVAPEQNKGSSNNIVLPVFGTINTKEISLPLLTAIIGLLDGFNPCAMWALLFLISLLLGIKDRKRMWILGVAFIVTSGFVYFLFMAAWLNMFLFVGYLPIIRIIIGFTAAGFGIYYLNKYFRNPSGCSTSEDEKRQEIFNKLKDITQRKSFFWSLFGIMLLAVAVNLVEMMCSVGLPAIYTNVLSSNKLMPIQYYLYLAGYILFFMLDDIIVFVIAMTTLQAVGIDSKYAKYSSLLGGIIIFIIGILMLFKPELLTFK